jgi:hypothetical protein
MVVRTLLLKVRSYGWAEMRSKGKKRRRDGWTHSEMN